MKTKKTFFAAMLLAGLVMNGTALAQGVTTEDALTSGAYCHAKFPAIDGRTLDSDQPVLKNAASGDLVDFYGPCDETPTGADQVQEQRLEAQHRMEIGNE
jgi:hypothetical protein